MNRDELAHELWAAAQLAPGEGISDAVARMNSLLAAQPAEAEGFQIARHSKRLVEQLREQLSAVTAERDRLREANTSRSDKLNEAQGIIDQLRAEVEGLQRDASRLDRLDIECEAYGCEGVHEGNRWMIDGPFRTVRDAIDAMAAKEA